MYTPRFIRTDDQAELVNLYHLARTALSGKECTPYTRMLWASKEFAKAHPEVSSTGAYKDLCGMLERNPPGDIGSDNPPKVKITGNGDLGFQLKITDSRGQTYGVPYSFASRSDAQEEADRIIKKYKINPPRKRFVKPYRVETWSERGEFTIDVYDANDVSIASWDTEGVNDMVESGYFDVSGFVMGWEVRPGRLEASVLAYIEETGIAKSRKNPPLPASALMDLSTARTITREVENGQRPVPDLHQAVTLSEVALKKLRTSHQGQIDFANPPQMTGIGVLNLTDLPQGKRIHYRLFTGHGFNSMDEVKEIFLSAFPDYSWVSSYSLKPGVYPGVDRAYGIELKLKRGAKRNPVTTSGYDRSKHPEQISYREMTLAEAKALRSGDHPKVLDRNGRLRDVMVNGAPKVWKTRPGDADIPLKYGMYEYLTARFRDGRSDGLLVVVEDEEKQNPPATLIYKDIVEIRAIKPNGDRYVHKFGKGSSIYGLPDGDILIRSRKGKRLWKNFKMEG